MKNSYEIAKDILQSVADKDDGQAGGFASIELYGESVHDKSYNDDICTRFQRENVTGSGEITLYKEFPGVELVYNDMHMEYCNKNQNTASVFHE